MVKLDIERANLSRRIYDLQLEAHAAWSFASTKDCDSLAGDMAEAAAMEADDEACRLLDKYICKYGSLPQGVEVPASMKNRVTDG